MMTTIRLHGRRGTEFEVRFSLDSLTNNVFVELLQVKRDGAKRPLASTLEARGGVAGRLLAGWFGDDK